MNSSSQSLPLTLSSPPLQHHASHNYAITVLQLLIPVVLATAAGTFLSLGSKGEGNARVQAPFIGSSRAWIARIKFLTNAKRVIWEGYEKFQDQVFKVSGNDMLILPTKYVDELLQLSDTHLDAIKANTDNFQGVYSATSILNEGNLHNFVLQTKLTPKLSLLIPIIEEELEYAMQKEFPKCDDDWQSAKAFDMTIRIVSRLASRLFVGPDLCRDEHWLATARGYTESVFRAIIFLRLFPAWLKPLMASIDINSWRVLYHLRGARRLLIPLVLSRRRRATDAAASTPVAAIAATPTSEHQRVTRGGEGGAERAVGTHDEENKTRSLKFTNLLQLMDDSAQGGDRDPEKLTRRTLVLTLASSHTTSMAACQALFELCHRPEYVPELREEVVAALREDGGWRKTTLSKMRKLDSFLRETQRIHPPSLLGFKRNVLQPITLSNDLHLPVGTHLLLPIAPHALSSDPRITAAAATASDPLSPSPSPSSTNTSTSSSNFDGLRWYRMRQSHPSQSHRFQFVTTDRHSLHFGHGRHACPGRFLASNVIKILLARLLLEYEFRFPLAKGKGKGEGEAGDRPADIHAHEYVFPDPLAKVEFRRRKAGE